MFEETFTVTKMHTFKHEPFLLVGRGRKGRHLEVVLYITYNMNILLNRGLQVHWLIGGSTSIALMMNGSTFKCAIIDHYQLILH